METIVYAVNLFLLIGLAIIPILIVRSINKLNIRLKFIVYLLFSIITTASISLTLGWWGDYSNRMLLEHYGFNFDYMNDSEKLQNVSPVNL